MMSHISSSLERYCGKEEINMFKGYDVPTASDTVVAQKGAYGFKCYFCTLDYMDNGWTQTLNKLLYELIQFDRGMWFTPEDEDQFQVNFDLLKIMEEYENDKETHTVKVQRLCNQM